jgi:hypothetical protein
MRHTNRPQNKNPSIMEMPNMIISKYFTLLAVTMLPLFTGFSQTAPVAAASQAGVPSSLSPGAVEVAKLVQSGVDDDVVQAYIGQSRACYNLSATDIAALKNAGVSLQAITAMLNHDRALHTQQQSPLPAAVTPAAQQTAASPSDAVVPPPPQVEVVPVAPGPDYLWTPGWWSWNGDAWIWFGGYWSYPSRPGHVWINGNFYHGRGVESVRGYRRW